MHLPVIDGLLRGRTLSFLPRRSEDSEIPATPDPRRAALIGLIFTLLLIAGSLFLVHILGRAARLQDCVMSGRTNCAPIDSTNPTDR
jgi:hypothetical protein